MKRRNDESGDIEEREWSVLLRGDGPLVEPVEHEGLDRRHHAWTT